MGLRLSLNGEPVEFPSPLTVEQLLTHLALDPAKVAVERNLAIVPRSTYGAVALSSGDRLEIVHFIGGGNEAAGVVPAMDKPFRVAGRTFGSRLIVGTGKYKSYAQNAAALEASGAEIVTVALRREKPFDFEPTLHWTWGTPLVVRRGEHIPTCEDNPIFCTTFSFVEEAKQWVARANASTTAARVSPGKMPALNGGVRIAHQRLLARARRRDRHRSAALYHQPADRRDPRRMSGACRADRR
jgi:thiamine biosynthesis protein ThiS